LATALDGVGCALIPDPDGPGRGAILAKAAKHGAAALGPAGPAAELPASWSLARTALRAAEAGALPSAGLIRVADHLGDLLLFESAVLAARIAARRLAPFESLTPKARERMHETALAYVRHGGNAVAMAKQLHLHPQTIRYRIARLCDLLGEQLDDPDSRFELEIALRHRGTGPVGRPANVAEGREMQSDQSRGEAALQPRR
jgi:sugar diacid utilization regulator